MTTHQALPDAKALTVPVAVTLSAPRKSVASAQGYVDLWTKGAEWPRGTEPITALHMAPGGVGVFDMDLSQARQLAHKVPGHECSQPWLVAVTELSWGSQADASEVLRFTRECYRLARNGHWQTHNDWVLTTQYAVLALQARKESGVGIENATGALHEVLGMREELFDDEMKIREELILEARKRNRREMRKRFLR